MIRKRECPTLGGQDSFLSQRGSLCLHVREGIRSPCRAEKGVSPVVGPRYQLTGDGRLRNAAGVCSCAGPASALCVCDGSVVGLLSALSYRKVDRDRRSSSQCSLGAGLFQALDEKGMFPGSSGVPKHGEGVAPRCPVAGAVLGLCAGPASTALSLPHAV